MGAAKPIESTFRLSSPKWRLVGIIEQLMELEADLITVGCRDEADSLRTVVGDLQWQYQKYDGQVIGGGRSEGDERATTETIRPAGSAGVE